MSNVVSKSRWRLPSPRQARTPPWTRIGRSALSKTEIRCGAGWLSFAQTFSKPWPGSRLHLALGKKSGKCFCSNRGLLWCSSHRSSKSAVEIGFILVLFGLIETYVQFWGPVENANFPFTHSWFFLILRGTSLSLLHIFRRLNWHRALVNVFIHYMN